MNINNILNILNFNNEKDKDYKSYFKYVQLQTDECYKIIISNKFKIILERLYFFYILLLYIIIIFNMLFLPFKMTKKIICVFPFLQVLITYYETLKFIIIIKKLQNKEINFSEDFEIDDDSYFINYFSSLKDHNIKYEEIQHKNKNDIIYIKNSLNGDFFKKVLITKSYLSICILAITGFEWLKVILSLPFDKAIDYAVEFKNFCKEHDRKRICRDFELYEIIQSIKTSYLLWCINSDMGFLYSSEWNYLKEYLRICFVSKNKNWKEQLYKIISHIQYIIGDSFNENFTRILVDNMEIKLKSFEN